MNESDIRHLNSILQQLRSLSMLSGAATFGGEDTATNVEWLTEFVAKGKAAHDKQKRNFVLAMEARRAAIAQRKKERV